MCTPSFTCKFPFSWRDFLAGAERRRTVRRDPRHCPRGLRAGTAYAKSPPPHRSSQSSACASRSTACRSPRARRCSRASAATSASSPAPTPTVAAVSARCSPRTAAAAAPTSSPSRARGTASRAPARRTAAAPTERELASSTPSSKRASPTRGPGARRGDPRPSHAAQPEAAHELSALARGWIAAIRRTAIEALRGRRSVRRDPRQKAAHPEHAPPLAPRRRVARDDRSGRVTRLIPRVRGPDTRAPGMTKPPCWRGSRRLGPGGLEPPTYRL